MCDGRPLCAAGQTQPCICPDGLDGVQSCEGDRWSTCACTTDSVCDTGETQACLCAGGESGVQSCEGDGWGDCTCGESCGLGDERSCLCVDGSAGTQECEFREWTECECEASGPRIHDPCYDSEECEGGADPMVCVFQSDGDYVGVCTILCASFADCVGSEFPGIWNCCDIVGGSSACLPSDWGC